jgi:hypothetical protein
LTALRPPGALAPFECAFRYPAWLSSDRWLLFVVGQIWHHEIGFHPPLSQISGNSSRSPLNFQCKEPRCTWQASNGHAEIARLLLEKGVDIKTEDEEGKTAPDEAAGRLCEAIAMLGQDDPHTKGLESVVRLLRKARGNVEGRRG